jgi:serine/threonine-protein kinase
MYRVFAGTLPEWPYSWPPPGLKRLENRLPDEFVAIVRRALKIKPTQRFRDAITMEKAFTNAIEKLSPEESTAKHRKRRN